MIAEILAKRDNAEIIAEQIAGLLKTEASPANAIRVFLERSDPWTEFLDASEQHAPESIPIVNVQYDSGTFDMSKSDVVRKQHTTSVFHVDCYGYGSSADNALTGGQLVGDERATEEVKRAVRVVRNVLMAAKYTYLDLRGVVWRRWVQNIQIFRPAQDSRPVQRVIGARVTFHVDHHEFSPQVEGEPLEHVFVTANLYRDPETSEVLFTADFQPGA